MELAPYFSVLAVISILYGAWLASVQSDIRGLIAYSSLSHLGFIVLGSFSFSLEALDGAVIQMTAHGISTAAMFILAEYMHQRRGSYELSAYRGLAPGAPLFALYLVITVMASVGLPGLSGFVGEFMILMGSFSSPVIASALAMLATLGVVLAAVYLLNFTRKALFGEASGEAFPALSLKEHLLLLPLLLMMFWIGLYAAPFQGVIDQAAEVQLGGVSQPAPLFLPVAATPAAAPDSLPAAHP
jgi:NADH-quinone oxidoreductase subunit M